MYLYLLSQENLDLAQAEVEALAQQPGERHKELLLLTHEVPHQLAFTRSISKVLGTWPGQLDWSTHILSPFAVRSHCTTPAKEVAAAIWQGLEAAGKRPEVNLSNPRTAIHLFAVKGEVLITKVIWENDEKFAARRSHLREQNHPTSLPPKLARCMVNLAGRTQRILDPFCGAGGILIEAALLGKEAAGSDIDAGQVARAEKNLQQLQLSATIRQGDAAMLSGDPVDAIVTDLPFGKNARLQKEGETFSTFFSAAKKLTSKMIIGTHDGCKIEAYLGEWKIAKEFTWYLHKSLSKKILLLTHASAAAAR